MAEVLAELAQAALADRTEPVALVHFDQHLARQPGDVAALHWQALLLRALDRRDEAIAALLKARTHSPQDTAIAHALAHVTLEAGYPATTRFEAALALAPDNREFRQGLTSARFAEGHGDAALAELGAFLAQHPDWLVGHRQFAQLAAQLSRPDQALATIERALATHPQAGALHLLAIELRLIGEDFAAMLNAIGRAEKQFGVAPVFQLNRAIALDELGRLGEAAALFDSLGPTQDPGHGVRRLRHLLRRGELVRAEQELESWLRHPAAADFWPYAALIWSALGDTRSEWLEGPKELIAIIDFAQDEVDLPALCALLRELHTGAGRFLDQSVRGGTQTDGALLARTDPAIVRLRNCLATRVEKHIAGLPDPDLSHPTLGKARNRPLRFAGSWSVRLWGEGHHASHHHPQGWFSSAMYLAVPEGLAGEEGRLVLGEAPPGLGLECPPRLVVEPRPGRLVLFPSTMWHATRPFDQGERLTIAFDVASP